MFFFLFVYSQFVLTMSAESSKMRSPSFGPLACSTFHKMCAKTLASENLWRHKWLLLQYPKSSRSPFKHVEGPTETKMKKIRNWIKVQQGTGDISIVQVWTFPANVGIPANFDMFKNQTIVFLVGELSNNVTHTDTHWFHNLKIKRFPLFQTK